MVYYPKDVLEKKIKQERKSNVKCYYGETIAEHYKDFYNGIKRCRLRFYFYNAKSRDLDYVLILCNSFYSNVIDVLKELGVCKADLDDIISHMSMFAQGAEEIFDAILYKGEIKVGVNIDFWKNRVLDKMNNTPLQSFLCNGYELKDGKVILTNDDVNKDKVIEIYPNNVINVKIF